MSPLARVYHLPVRRRARTTAITVAQFAELMAAIDALPERIADELERRGNVPPRIDIDQDAYQQPDDDLPL